MSSGFRVVNREKVLRRISTQASKASYQVWADCQDKFDAETLARVARYSYNLMVDLMERKVYAVTVNGEVVYKDTSTRRIAHFIRLAQRNGISPDAIKEREVYMSSKRLREVSDQFSGIWNEIDASLLQGRGE